MKQSVILLIERFKHAPWFSRLGQRGDVQDVAYADDLEKALKSFATSKWHGYLGDASNVMSRYLHTHHHAVYQKWNEVVGELNPDVDEMVQFISSQELSPLRKRHLPALRLTILYVYTYVSYSDIYQNAFFDKVIEILEFGHLPCGWTTKESSDEEGRLIIV